MSEEYCHDCGQYYIKSTGLNYHFGCNVKRDKDYRCCDCWWSKAEIARARFNAQLTMSITDITGASGLHAEPQRARTKCQRLKSRKKKRCFS